MLVFTWLWFSYKHDSMNSSWGGFCPFCHCFPHHSWAVCCKLKTCAQGKLFPTLWWIDDQAPDDICIMEVVCLITPNSIAALDPLILNRFVNKCTSGGLFSELLCMRPSSFIYLTVPQFNILKISQVLLGESASTKLWINNLTLCTIYLSLSSLLFLLFCVDSEIYREESGPEGRGRKRGFYNLACGAVSAESCLLDYARDAPALNLISFNICLRVLS